MFAIIVCTALNRVSADILSRLCAVLCSAVRFALFHVPMHEVCRAVPFGRFVR